MPGKVPIVAAALTNALNSGVACIVILISLFPRSFAASIVPLFIPSSTPCFVPEETPSLRTQKDYQILQHECSACLRTDSVKLNRILDTCSCSHGPSPKVNFCFFVNTALYIFYHGLKILGLIEPYLASSINPYLEKRIILRIVHNH